MFSGVNWHFANSLHEKREDSRWHRFQCNKSKLILVKFLLYYNGNVSLNTNLHVNYKPNYNRKQAKINLTNNNFENYNKNCLLFFANLIVFALKYPETLVLWKNLSNKLVLESLA